MKKGYHKGRELSMSELGLSLEELSGQPLELFAREGARLLLMVGLEEEVTSLLYLIAGGLFLISSWLSRKAGSSALSTSPIS